MPDSRPISSKRRVPFGPGVLWKKKFRTVSFATNRSGQPSPSGSHRTTPSALATGRGRAEAPVPSRPATRTPAASAPAVRAARLVVEQAVAADGGDEQVGPAVVVVVANARAQAVDADGQPAGGGHVLEGAVARVAVEGERGRRFGGLVAGPGAGVDE